MSPTVQICMSEGDGAISTFESDISIDHLQIFGCSPPCEITCPADITVSNDPGVCEAFVNIPQPTLMGTTCAPVADPNSVVNAGPVQAPILFTWPGSRR